LGISIYQHFEKEVEFWKAAEILNFLKDCLFNGKPGLIGHAKQILAYRDWVGHGKNPKKLPSTDMKPVAAYNTFNEIVETLSFYGSDAIPRWDSIRFNTIRFLVPAPTSDCIAPTIRANFYPLYTTTYTNYYVINNAYPKRPLRHPRQPSYRNPC
jgi:hypothetical protein